MRKLLFFRQRFDSMIPASDAVGPAQPAGGFSQAVWVAASKPRQAVASKVTAVIGVPRGPLRDGEAGIHLFAII